MYIEEIILEGFKSYATRTVISGWDPEFNAITGLNGTGKSNILDAICFVLGIDNLRQVRAVTLQDLVYKRGQSGISKASVSLVFNNADSQKSPVGYADCPQITVTRQIILGGKNRYLINGHVAQQKQVDTMFHSVQLNVNNPHFLIMQGQITKVLNMRPPEILAMVEESAGTRMFEDRKEKALQTLAKKEGKVQEINALLAELIDPKLSHLREQRSDFMEFKRNEAELERARKIVVASDHVSLGKSKQSMLEFIEQSTDQLQTISSQEASFKQELCQIDRKLEEVTKKKQRELKNAEKVKDLEEQAGNAEREKTRITAQLELLQQSQSEEQNRLEDLSGAEKSLRAQLEQQQSLHEAEERKSGEMGFQLETSRTNLKREEDLLSSIQGSGMEGAVGAYARIINELKDKNVNVTVEIESLKQRVTFVQAELNQSAPKLDKAQKGCSGIVKSINALQNEISELQSQIPQAMDNNIDYEHGHLIREKKRLESELSEASEAVQALRSQVSHALKFDYQMPSSFDHSKVKGVLAGLIELPDSHTQYASALEITAGGKLYNVVVEDEHTAKQLLEKGKLTRRVTIIPLNKIVPREIAADKIKAADRLAHGKSRLALSLIGYAEEVESAMRFAFGGTFVCDDRDAANKITFDRSCGIRSVTVDGDVYEPSGTLTGGSAPNTSALLERISVFNQHLAEERELQLQLDIVCEKLDNMDSQNSAHEQTKQKVELKQHELSLLQQQLEQNSSGKIVGQIKLLQDQLDDMTHRQDKLVQEKTGLESQIARMESEQSETGKDKQSKIKSLEKQVSLLRKSVQKEEGEYKKMTGNVQVIAAMIVRINNDLKELQVSMRESKSAIDESECQLNTLSNVLDQQKNTSRELQKKLDHELRTLRQFDTELRALEERRAFLQDSQEKASMEQKQLATSLHRSKEELARMERDLAYLHKQHPWIVDQEHLFGRPDGPFAFPPDMAEVRGRVKLLECEHQSSRKHININVMHMIDRDFGTIFAELLPGSSARLDKPAGTASITAGLEIKVRLGATWKDSLSELSGGQRSLIALSLILALLHHKPAPLYILDEVDAALDPSHTQNIGRILKSPRFHGAQFIIVSLKEGMFGNANVLFRTRFKEGISHVERSVGENSEGSLEGGHQSGQKRVVKMTGKPLSKKTEIKVE